MCLTATSHLGLKQPYMPITRKPVEPKYIQLYIKLSHELSQRVNAARTVPRASYLAHPRHFSQAAR